ncbi:MAG TPA: aminoglycoside phosphotransferase family protein [Candidatus Dormibacteraeota bacterium]|nr:aminoglycoside phosphotransferase family protein [Candidatus Dormibacteraeota bacterium]
MRVLNLAAIIDEICNSEAAIGGPVQRTAFIGQSHADVYRVTAGGRTFIAHASRQGIEYLMRLRANLDRVAVLEDDRIPREVAWRTSNGAWAVLMYPEIAGEELHASNATDEALESLGDLLRRLHSVEDPGHQPSDLAGRVNEPSAFAAFGEMLIHRLSDLPIRTDRVRHHLDVMSAYLREHASEFQVPTRLIHGDLHRSNIVSTGTSVGLLDWGDLTAGDYAFDLAALKFILDAVAPRKSTQFIRARARDYAQRFHDGSLEIRMRFFLALAGLVRAFNCADDSAALRPSRAWRVRACYLHSETQWRSPLMIDGPSAGAPVARTEDFAVDMRQPIRGLFYLLAPKRVS